tara:strand:- start:5698 stop:6756 length:1059 start_codon:yes stop_codon:yes gene_type:complete
MKKKESFKSSIRVAEYHNNSDIRIKNISMPKIGENEILIKMQACGICGTDVMEWYRKKSAPKVLGHEMSGLIADVGKNIEKYKVNDRVFVSHHVPCFDCFYCDSDKHSACDSLHTGNFYPGGFSEFIRVPEDNVNYGTFILPDDMGFDEATMIEPMACAVAGQKSMQMDHDQFLVILGSGISGLCHIQLAKNKNIKILATDISENRMNQALEYGADYSFHADELCVEKVKELNGGRLADKVIVCTGSSSAVEDAFKYIDKKGEILFFAVPEGNIEIPSTMLWRNEISLHFSYGASTNDIAETIELSIDQKIDLQKMISHQISLSDISYGFKLVERAEDSIKVVVKPDELIEE